VCCSGLLVEQSGCQEGVLQRVAVCCSVLQGVGDNTVCYSVSVTTRCVAVCRRVLQYVAVCCTVLQWLFWLNNVVANKVRRRMLQRGAVCCRSLQCAAVCCNVLQRVAACCSVLQCIAEYYGVLQCVALACMAQRPHGQQSTVYVDI